MSQQVSKDIIKEVVDLFWDELKCFEKRKGHLTILQGRIPQLQFRVSFASGMEKHSLPYTCVFAFVACCATSKSLGIGPCEQNWTAVKSIKTGKRVNIGEDLQKKMAVLYASALINDAKTTRTLNENIATSGPNALLCDHDMK